MTLLILLLILAALLCFVLATLGVSSRVDLTALGLVFLTIWLAITG